MSAYKVTIKLTETFIYEADDAMRPEDAITQAFRDRHLWSYEYERDEYSVTTEQMEDE